MVSICATITHGWRSGTILTLKNAMYINSGVILRDNYARMEVQDHFWSWKIYFLSIKHDTLALRKQNKQKYI